MNTSRQKRRHIGIHVFVLVFAALSEAPTAQPQSACGVVRWRVKVGIDDDAARVDTSPIRTTVAELVSLTRPQVNFPQRKRVAPVELQTFLLRARLVRVVTEDDSDLHLVLRDLDNDRLTLVAEIPHPACAGDDALALRFEAARHALRRVTRNGLVEITGIGFFDSLHGQSGMAENGFEIHPVLRIRVIRP